MQHQIKPICLSFLARSPELIPSIYHFLEAEPLKAEHAMATGTCHHPNCAWISLGDISSLEGHVPHLHAEPELSGIGVILGFALTAYLTLLLLILHYFLVYDPHKTSPKGKFYTNPLDRRLLSSIRGTFIWIPTKRFEYALERSVLLLSDTQLVTGLAILISEYSQLSCGISAYHWQIMVYVAWFASFTFLSAMSFLQSYFKTNHSLRILRAFFMVILASLLITALLPTGSRNWLDLTDEGGGFYPSLSTSCYFRQLTLDTYSRGGLKLWSMILSILVVGISYIQGGIKLFDTTAEITRTYLRTWPGIYVKRLLYTLERKTAPKGLRASSWMLPYLLCYAIFTVARASWDIIDSMLMEIIWISFALIWGTIKLITTRRSAVYNNLGDDVDANPDVLAENYSSFGQTLPLILLLLPVLSMAQAYLDNDAKAHELKYTQETETSQTRRTSSSRTPETADLDSVHVDPASMAKSAEQSQAAAVAQPPRENSSCPLHRCRHHNSPFPSPPPSRPSSRPPTSSPSPSHNPLTPPLPRYPYPLPTFHTTPWYTDLLTLLILQTLMVASFILALLNQVGSFLGLSFFLRSRLFLIWILGMVPLAAGGLLGCWWVGGALVRIWRRIRRHGKRRDSEEEGVGGSGNEYALSYPASTKTGQKRKTINTILFRALRLLLISGWLVFTFFMSFEIAGPTALSFDRN